MRRAVLLLALCAGCIGPSSYDSLTDGGRYELRHDDPWRLGGQPGVTDMRSGSQNSFQFRFDD